jgi:hypothetical protein
MKSIHRSILLAIAALLAASMACIETAEADNTVSLPQVQATQELPTAEIVAPTAVPACFNIYLPVRTDAAWNYRVTGFVNDTFTRSITAVNPDKFTEKDTFSSGVVRKVKWRCDNGNLTALNPPSGASASINEEGVWVDFQTTELTGVTIPASLIPGAAWTQTITIEGTQAIYQVNYKARNKITSNCTAIGNEPVTVGAGSFEAMKVECRIVMDINLTIEDKPNQTTLNLIVTNWYAANVGLVKSVTTGEGLDAAVELLSYSIPPQ